MPANSASPTAPMLICTEAPAACAFTARSSEPRDLNTELPDVGLPPAPQVIDPGAMSASASR